MKGKGAPYALLTEGLRDEKATEAAHGWISGMGVTIEAADSCERVPVMRDEEGFARLGKAIDPGAPLVPKNLDEPRTFGQARLNELLEPRRKLGLLRDKQVRRHARCRVPLPDGWALSCRTRHPGELGAPRLQYQTLPRSDWNALWPGHLQRLVGRRVR